MTGSEDSVSQVAGVPSEEAQEKAVEEDKVLLGDGGEREQDSPVEQISERLSSWAGGLRGDRSDEGIDIESAGDAARRGSEIISDYSAKFEIDEDRRENWQEEMRSEFQPVFEQIDSDFHDVAGSIDADMVWEFNDSNHLSDDYGFDFGGGTLTSYFRSAISQVREHDEQLESYNEQLGDLLDKRRQTIEERDNKIELHEKEREEDKDTARDTDIEIEADRRDELKEVVQNNAEGRIEEAEAMVDEFEQGSKGDEIRRLLGEIDREEAARQQVIDALDESYQSITSRATEVAETGLDRADELLSRAEAYSDLVEDVEEMALTEIAPLGVDTGVPELKRHLNDVIGKTANRVVEISEEVESAAEYVGTVEDIVPDEVSEDIAEEIRADLSSLVDRYSEDGSYDSLTELVEDRYGSLVDLGPLDAIHDEGVELEKKRDEYTE